VFGTPDIGAVEDGVCDGKLELLVSGGGERGFCVRVGEFEDIFEYAIIPANTRTPANTQSAILFCFFLSKSTPRL
jgi:hypothetical protein